MSRRWFPLKCINTVSFLTSRSGLALGISITLLGAGPLQAGVHQLNKLKDPKAKISPSTQKTALKAAAHALPPILQEVEAKYSKSNTLTAEFTQTNTGGALNQSKTNIGKILVKKPSKIRWETVKPDPSLLISDGQKVWFYTPPFEEGERGQLIERKSREAHSQLAQSLLSGSFSVTKDMGISQKSESSFILTPKKGSAGTVRTATIEIDPKSHLIKKVILDHEGGNHSEISLEKIELGASIADDQFDFKMPPNTDRMDEE